MVLVRPVGAVLFHADRQTDMKKLTVAFRNFSNAPKLPVEALTVGTRMYGDTSVLTRNSPLNILKTGTCAT
jgi:hypothetical protein